MTRFHPSLDLADVPAESPIMVICSLEALTLTPTIAGDTHRDCGECHRTVRLAPTSQAILAEAEKLGRVTCIRCLTCAGAVIMADPDTEFAMAPGAVDEIITRLGGK